MFWLHFVGIIALSRRTSIASSLLAISHNVLEICRRVSFLCMLVQYMVSIAILEAFFDCRLSRSLVIECQRKEDTIQALTQIEDFPWKGTDIKE